MSTDIRKYVINNFKNSCKVEIKEAISASIKEREDITLPGLGVFFELLWEHSNNNIRNEILDILENNLK